MFDISAGTYRLKNTTNMSDGKKSIIEDGEKYVVPIYQREYSWREKELVPFIQDIFNGFWGSGEEKDLILDPMFIGTMQLSDKDQHGFREVIDGQQRLSTFICLLYYLKLKYAKENSLKDIDLEWFSTRVNNGREQSYFNEMMAIDSTETLTGINDNKTNNYIRNLKIISETFEECIKDSEGSEIPLFSKTLGEFIEYVLNSVYFVVVETQAGLSKTIKIFNTINSTGLDLGTDDLFKIRMYEYMGAREEAFNEISKVYSRIKEENDKHKGLDISIGSTLKIYQNYLISKHKLTDSYYSMSKDTFFERLFDRKLHLSSSGEKYKDFDGVELKLDDLHRIIDVQVLWDPSYYKDATQYISYNLTNWTRYSRYNSIAYLIMLRNDSVGSDTERLDMVYQYLFYFSRYLFCANIGAKRVENYATTYCHKSYKSAYNDKWEDAIGRLKKSIKDGWSDEVLTNNLSQDIFQRRLWKESVCRLSAYLDEMEFNPNIQLSELKEKLSHNYGFDIEHIHSRKDPEFEFDDLVLLNSIGNLMLLEGSINKSVSNNPFKEKLKSPDGSYDYSKSNYACAKLIIRDHSTDPKWTEELAYSRRAEEVKRIISFIRAEI